MTERNTGWRSSWGGGGAEEEESREEEDDREMERDDREE